MSNPPPPPPSSDPGGFQPPAYAPQAPGMAGMGGPPQNPSNGMGVAALVLGILSILGGLFIVGGVLGILAVIFGFIGRSKAKRGEATNGGMALAGIITGFVGIALSLLIVVLAVFIVSSDGFDNLFDCLESANTEAERQQCADDFEF